MIERGERKIALITGAASGIGRATAEAFSQSSRYGRIYAADIDPAVHVTFDSLKHPGIIPMELDVRSFRQVDEALGRIVDEVQKIDVLINSAGTIAATGNGNENAADQKMHISMMQTNDESVRYLMEQTALKMSKRGGGGTIVIVTSSKDAFPDPYRREYERSKSSIEAYSLRKAREYARDNVRVVVVKPGNTKTNIDRGSWMSPGSQAEMSSVQNFNDWWRRTFGNDPKNVAEVIYRIAEGEIRDNKVFVGFDAKLGQFLVRTIPGWRQIFYMGSSALYGGVKMLGQLRSKQIVTTNHADPNSLSGEWFKEGVIREAEAKFGTHVQVVKVGDAIYTRIMGSDSVGGHVEGVQFDLNKMEELGVSQEALERYLDLKAEELGNRTMLLDNCEPDSDGDWKYSYAADRVNEDAAFGTITVTFKGQVIFSHYLTVRKVQ